MCDFYSLFRGQSVGGQHWSESSYWRFWSCSPVSIPVHWSRRISGTIIGNNSIYGSRGKVTLLDIHLCNTLLMRANKVKTAVQWFSMSYAVVARFSGYGNSIYNITLLDSFLQLFVNVYLCRYKEDKTIYLREFQWSLDSMSNHIFSIEFILKLIAHK